ncbi:MAG: succinate dehydrogenase assembly factor 2 [Rhodobiaceae bacterium]|nr:succinate dehydrogenase assembly factor 2 [Rhodobiaceae bacterium]MCC0015045.1 succinate dehydrogenase assembly factor 2 [Rhodobiaceae bacterium]MCC0052947.1 succinate dehydrogenase assembly factor 2 [Rhodobiaceae bacterium]
MTGTTLSSENLDPRRRRILFRAWRRGTREMDLVMGRFADQHLPAIDGRDLDDLEALIDVADADLFNWITGEKPVPEAYDTPVFRALRAFSHSQTPAR